MLLRKYEIVVILNPEAGEAGMNQAVGRMREALASKGGQEVRLEDWGVRRLAYELRRTSKGHYLYLLFLGTNQTVAEIERLLGITEAAIKFQTILLEDRVDPATFDFELAKSDLTAFGRGGNREAQA